MRWVVRISTGSLTLTLLLALASCGGQAGQQTETSPTGAETRTTPSGLAGFHDPTVRTGIPAVDGFLDALAKADVLALRDLVVMTSTECRTPGSGGPPRPEPDCPPGVPDGTVVDAFLRAACQPMFTLDPAEARDATAQLASPQQYVYAVYKGGFGVPSDAPSAFTVVMGTDMARAVTQVSLDGAGRVTGLVVCSEASPELWTATGVPGDNLLVLPPVVQ